MSDPLTLPRILALLAALAVLTEMSLMWRDNWRVDRALLIARLGSRLFLVGTLIYLFFVPPVTPRAAMLIVAIMTYFTAEAIHRVTARRLKKTMGIIFK